MERVSHRRRLEAEYDGLGREYDVIRQDCEAVSRGARLEAIWSAHVFAAPGSARGVEGNIVGRVEEAN